MNPMARKPVLVDEQSGRRYVEMGTDKDGNSIRRYQDEFPLDGGVEWIEDSSAEGFAYIWDNALRGEFNHNAKCIHDRRVECTTPRGVLGKIWQLVGGQNAPQLESVVQVKDNDFPWFLQVGNVYSDSSKGVFSKYTNLHLGRAYQVMSPKEWHELTGLGVEDEQYVKPQWNDDGSFLHAARKMLEGGFHALQDAFSVMLKERTFNIYNADAKQVEEFNPDHAQFYSQGQCALVIERVFSRLYKYLQFKSTTSETFLRHINIDSGYKYLTSDCILASDNENSGVYYDDGDQVPYLRYLAKLGEYLDEGEHSDVLAEDECGLLGKFVGILSNKFKQDWRLKEWNLCPVLSYEDVGSLWSPLAKRAMSSRAPEEVTDDSTPKERVVCVNFNLGADMKWGDDHPIHLPEGTSLFLEESATHLPVLVYGASSVSDNQFRFNLEEVSSAVKSLPVFIHKDTSIEYQLMGFSTDKLATQPQYSTRDAIYAQDFKAGQLTLMLYAIWRPKKILVQFEPGRATVENPDAMPHVLVSASKPYVVPECSYVESHILPRFTYHESDSWERVDASGTEMLCPHVFSHWVAHVQGQDVDVDPFGALDFSAFSRQAPVVTLSAQWEFAWNVIRFRVEEEVYCEALVSKKTPILHLPKTPKLTASDQVFLIWDMVDGSALPSLAERPPLVVCDVDGHAICGDSSNPTDVMCEPESGTPIVCHDTTPVVCEGADPIDLVVCHGEGQLMYGFFVDAWVGIDAKTLFNVIFRFYELGESGEVEMVDRVAHVMSNHKLPVFHIHNEVVVDGKRLVFRYWKLESGNLTSSMSVMSDLVITAVYDEVGELNDWQAQDIPEPVVLQPVEDNRDERELVDCPYMSTNTRPVEIPVRSDSEATEHYCELCGLNPLEYGSRFEEWDKCPYVRMLQTVKKCADDFAEMTLIEIEDIDKLLKALFKVNIDIAHREYYLKIDIPEASDWWYGYKEGDRWISFEPVVEFKFSNLHAANQVVDGKLVCTIDESTDALVKRVQRLTPVNRELLSDEGAIHYNDFFYRHDYERSLKAVWELGHATTFPHLTVHGWNGRSICELEELFAIVCDCDCFAGKPTVCGDGTDPVVCDPVEDPHAVVCDHPDSLPISYGEVVCELGLDDAQRYYDVEQLHLYENSRLQDPTDVHDFIPHRLEPIVRRPEDQVMTFTSIVKKYRPLVMPNVRDIFNLCQGSTTKYQADIDNDYGVFGWCTIPSKTMVDMEYNEQAIIVPSSYDHHNRVGGSNFLQMDYDFCVDVSGERRSIYEKWVGEDKDNGALVDNTKNTWYYLYNTRDWTYFMQPFFNTKRNSELYSYMLDTYKRGIWPKNSDHINGIVFEASNQGRTVNSTFGDMATTCQFLAKHHHNEHNLTTLSERFTNLISYNKLKELTSVGQEGFNSMYGSKYIGVPDSFRFPISDWVDEYDKTGSYLNLTVGEYLTDGQKNELDPKGLTQLKYKYNLGQAHAIDDFDEDSVWFYITMVEPVEQLDQVIQLEDIMPFVFWWDNRGIQNNGPTVDCYGLASSAKLNYEQGGWCYSSGQEGQTMDVRLDENLDEHRTPIIQDEQRWHAVQRTLGVDFSEAEYGPAILTSDNSGNVYKGAFDPNCIGTNEKWKVHHGSNSFGTSQHEDPTEDKYLHGELAHGEGEWQRQLAPSSVNEGIVESIKDRPMVWNLWNVVRHYAWIKYFKGKHREIGTDEAQWQELEKRTEKLVKGIYRTFQQGKRSTFGDLDQVVTHYGQPCQVHWTNSFIEVSTILERNAREHDASFVLFTGDIRQVTDDAQTQELVGEWQRQLEEDAERIGYSLEIPDDYPTKRKLALAKRMHELIRNSTCNFRVLSLNGIDASDNDDGIRPRKWDSEMDEWVSDSEDGQQDAHVFQGWKYSQLPTSYILAGTTALENILPDINETFLAVLDFDKTYPESEYTLDDKTKKWVRKVRGVAMSRQTIPVYTSMEGMETDVHDLTI